MEGASKNELNAMAAEITELAAYANSRALGVEERALLQGRISRLRFRLHALTRGSTNADEQEGKIGPSTGDTSGSEHPVTRVDNVTDLVRVQNDRATPASSFVEERYIHENDEPKAEFDEFFEFIVRSIARDDCRFLSPASSESSNGSIFDQPRKVLSDRKSRMERASKLRSPVVNSNKIMSRNNGRHHVSPSRRPRLHGGRTTHDADGVSSVRPPVREQGATVQHSDDGGSSLRLASSRRKRTEHKSRSTSALRVLPGRSDGGTASGRGSPTNAPSTHSFGKSKRKTPSPAVGSPQKIRRTDRVGGTDMATGGLAFQTANTRAHGGYNVSSQQAHFLRPALPMSPRSTSGSRSPSMKLRKTDCPAGRIGHVGRSPRPVQLRSPGVQNKPIAHGLQPLALERLMSQSDRRGLAISPIIKKKIGQRLKSVKTGNLSKSAREGRGYCENRPRYSNSKDKRTQGSPKTGESKSPQGEIEQKKRNPNPPKSNGPLSKNERQGGSPETRERHATLSKIGRMPRDPERREPKSLPTLGKRVEASLSGRGHETPRSEEKQLNRSFDPPKSKSPRSNSGRRDDASKPWEHNTSVSTSDRRLRVPGKGKTAELRSGGKRVGGSSNGGGPARSRSRDKRPDGISKSQKFESPKRKSQSIEGKPKSRKPGTQRISPESRKGSTLSLKPVGQRISPKRSEGGPEFQKPDSSRSSPLRRGGGPELPIKQVSTLGNATSRSGGLKQQKPQAPRIDSMLRGRSPDATGLVSPGRKSEQRGGSPKPSKRSAPRGSGERVGGSPDPSQTEAPRSRSGRKGSSPSKEKPEVTRTPSKPRGRDQAARMPASPRSRGKSTEGGSQLVGPGPEERKSRGGQHSPHPPVFESPRNKTLRAEGSPRLGKPDTSRISRKPRGETSASRVETTSRSKCDRSGGSRKPIKRDALRVKGARRAESHKAPQALRPPQSERTCKGKTPGSPKVLSPQRRIGSTRSSPESLGCVSPQTENNERGRSPELPNRPNPPRKNKHRRRAPGLREPTASLSRRQVRSQAKGCAPILHKSVRPQSKSSLEENTPELTEQARQGESSELEERAPMSLLSVDQQSKSKSRVPSTGRGRSASPRRKGSRQSGDTVAESYRSPGSAGKSWEGASKPAGLASQGMLRGGLGFASATSSDLLRAPFRPLPRMEPKTESARGDNNVRKAGAHSPFSAPRFAQARPPLLPLSCSGYPQQTAALHSPQCVGSCVPSSEAALPLPQNAAVMCLLPCSYRCPTSRRIGSPALSPVCSLNSPPFTTQTADVAPHVLHASPATQPQTTRKIDTMREPLSQAATSKRHSVRRPLPPASAHFEGVELSTAPHSPTRKGRILPNSIVEATHDGAKLSRLQCARRVRRRAAIRIQRAFRLHCRYLDTCPNFHVQAHRPKEILHIAALLLQRQVPQTTLRCIVRARAYGGVIVILNANICKEGAISAAWQNLCYGEEGAPLRKLDPTLRLWDREDWVWNRGSAHRARLCYGI